MGIPGPKPRRKGVVWTKEFAYAVGLMVADGNLSPDGRHLVFVSTDKELPEYVKTAFEVRANIFFKLNQKGSALKHYRLQWGDVFLYDFFLQIGLTPKKSLTIGQILVPSKYFFHFFRGVFDGDGCFYSYFDPRWKSSFMYYVSIASGSKKFIDWLQKEVQNRTGVKGHISHSKSSEFVYQLRYAKKEGFELLGHMYKDKEKLYLIRKRLKIEEALSIVGKSLPR